MSVVFPEPELIISESELSELAVSLQAQDLRVPRNPVTMVMGIGDIASEGTYNMANSCRHDRPDRLMSPSKVLRAPH